MSKLLCALAAILVLQIPAVQLQMSGSGSGSGSGGGLFGPPLFPLASVASLTQEQRNSIVTVGFRGINEQQFVQNGVNVFRQEVTDITNDYFRNGNRIAKRQQRYTPQDITVLDSPTVVDGVLMVEFIVGGQNGQSTVSSREMAALIEREGPRLAMALEAALNVPVQFAGVMEAQNAQALSQTAVIGIVIGAVGAIVLVAVVLVVIAIVSCIRTIRKRRAGKSESAEYVAVSEPEDGTTEFSSNWQPMKVNMKGDYTAVPASTFNGNSNNTAL